MNLDTDWEIQEECDHDTEMRSCLMCGGIVDIICINCGKDFAIPEYELDQACTCEEPTLEPDVDDPHTPMF